MNDRTARMQAMAEQGHNNSAIGRAFGISDTRVRELIGPSRSGQREKTHILTDPAFWLDRHHMMNSEIAEEVGLDNHTVSKYRTLPMDPAVRFWSKVAPQPNGCWLWQGGCDPTGYGRVNRLDYAHRVAFELANGSIPEDRWVLHKCHNPACVNPEHLYAGTPKDNVRDAIERRGGIHWLSKAVVYA